MWYVQGKVGLYLIKYHTINTHIELSLKQTQCLQIILTPTAADGEFVGWTVNCMKRGILHTVRDWAVILRKKLKKEHTSSSNSVVHEINTIKDFYSLFTSALRQLFSHTDGYNRRLQRIYNSVSTASCSNNKACSFRQFCHTFHPTFPSVYGR